jgi:hypothetical protein
MANGYSGCTTAACVPLSLPTSVPLVTGLAHCHKNLGLKVSGNYTDLMIKVLKNLNCQNSLPSTLFTKEIVAHYL